MPVVAIGAAIVAGFEVASVGLAAMSAFEAMAAIGAITAGIGTVTGNDDLVKIGGPVGLIGGIGSYASGTGVLGFGKDTALDSVGNAAADSSFVPDNSIQASLSAPVKATEDIVTAAKPVMATENLGLAERLSAPVSEVAPGLNSSLAAGNTTGVLDSSLTKAVTGGATPLAPASSSFMDFMAKTGSVIKDNPMAASMAMNAVSGMFDFAGQDLKKAQTDRLKQDALAMEQQRTNANSVPDMTGMQVNPAALTAIRNNANTTFGPKPILPFGPKPTGIATAGAR